MLCDFWVASFGPFISTEQVKNINFNQAFITLLKNERLLRVIDSFQLHNIANNIFKMFVVIREGKLDQVSVMVPNGFQPSANELGVRKYFFIGVLLH